jgi:putative selenate reductase molybdopterin-binding subunit
LGNLNLDRRFKIEYVERATGRAKFVSDMSIPGMLHGKILRSPHPHARILNVDTTEATAVTGVKAVVTGKIAENICKPYGPQVQDERCLQPDKVRFVGDEVAAVAAVSEEIAEQALKLIRVEYEILPAVLDVTEAVKSDAPQIHDHAKNNILKSIRVKTGDAEAALGKADFVVQREYITSRVTATPAEPHVTLASFDPFTKHLTVWSSSQVVFFARHSISSCFGLPENNIRVIAPHVGGGFGQKSDAIYSNDVCAIILSMMTERPVKIHLSREEETTATRTRHLTRRHLEIGLSKDGTIQAIREKTLADTGAYASYGPAVAWATAITAPGPYKIPNVDAAVDLVYTNNPTAGAFRGLGVPQSAFSRESLLDEAAEAAGIDPLELRMKNVIKTVDLPFTTSTGQIVRTCGVLQCLEEVTKKIGYYERKRDKRPNEGIGLAAMLFWSGGRWPGSPDVDCSSANVTVTEDGTAIVYSGIAEIGQGIHRGLARIAAEELGIRPGDVSVVRADTEKTPLCLGTWGSRGAVVAGSAVRLAAQDARNQLLNAAANLLDLPPEELEMVDGMVRSKESPEKSTSIRDLASSVYYTRKTGGPRAIIGRGSWDAPTEQLTEKGGHWCSTYPFSAAAVRIAVDPESGRVDVLDIASAHDVGKAIDRDLVLGQIHGGVCQGLGWTFFEDMIFDEAGHPLNPSFRDYLIPTMSDIPDISAIVVESGKDDTIPAGVKGVGETGLICVAAAVANAVYDAVGIRFRELPITPERIALAIHKKSTTR